VRQRKHPQFAGPTRIEHIVFLLANANGQIPQGMTAEIQGVKVTDSVFNATDWQVVDGGSTPVPVAGIEIEVGQIEVLGENSIRMFNTGHS
jgi:hypothetical protein